MKVTILGLSFLLSKILGLVRDHLLASSFGAGDREGIFNLDTYYAAFRLPDLLYNLLSFGVLSAGFVPLFIEIMKKEGRENAWKFSQHVLFTFSGVIALVSILLFFAADFLMEIFVPGFSVMDREVTIIATRLMLLTPLIFTLSSVCGGIQNALGNMTGLALAPLMYNLGIIAGIFFGAEKYGVYAVSMGVLAGALLHLMVQLPGVFRAGFHFLPRVGLWSVQVKEMLVLSLPRIIGMSVNQISLVITTIIASTLTMGSITILNLATNLQSLPMGVVGISVAIVSFSTLSKYAVEGDMKDFVQELKNNLRRILFILIPTTVGMFILRFEIISILFSWGKFGANEVEMTAQTMGILLSGLIFGSIVFLLARAFYALKNTKIPVIIGICAVGINLITSLLFTRIFFLETYGLAIAMVAADIVNALLLWIFLTRRLKSSLVDLPEMGKIIISSALMAAGVYGVKTVLQGEIIVAFTATILGVLIYGLTSVILKSREIQKII